MRFAARTEAARGQRLFVDGGIPAPAHQPGHAHCGAGNLFMVFEPLAGRRHVEVTAHRTAVDYARVVQELFDVRHPQATPIVLVPDDLVEELRARRCRAVDFRRRPAAAAGSDPGA